MVKALLVSDTHGDTGNLELVVKTALAEGIDFSMHCGDIQGPSFSQITSKNYQEAAEKKFKLLKDSTLRKAIIKGKISEEMLSRWKKNIDLGSRVFNKIAEQTAVDAKKLLEKTGEYIITAGNWDSKKAFEIFRDSFADKQIKNMKGINILGLSGGGSASTLTDYANPEALFSDSVNSRDYKARQWAQLLRQGSFLEADVIMSHIHPSDGEGVEKENATEIYKSLIKNLNQMKKAKGINSPNILIHGHKHSSSVKYDKELESFSVCPGSASRDHNPSIPSFMIAEFDNKRLDRIFKYEIRSSLKGLSNVVLTEEYILDYENKKVKTNKIQKTVVAESDINKFKDYLSLDDNSELIKKGVCIKYKGLNAKEKDALLRRNIAVMFKDLEDNSKKIKEIVMSAGFDAKGKPTRKDIDKIYYNLSEEALKRFNASLEHVEDRFKNQFRDLIIQVAFGIKPGDVYFRLSKNMPLNTRELNSWSDKLVKSANENQSRMYQQYIFKDLKAKDYQEMADLYLPLDYERKESLHEKDSFNFWVQTYYNGILTDKDFADVAYAYKKKKDFKKNKKTKKQIMKMFNFADSEDEESQEESQQPDIEKIRKFIEQQQSNSKRLEYLANGVKQGQIPVITMPDGRECFATQEGYKDFEREKLGLKKGDYVPISIDEFIEKQQAGKYVAIPVKNTQKQRLQKNQSFRQPNAENLINVKK